MVPVNVRFESGDRFEFNWDPHGETLLVPLEAAPGVVIPPGSNDSHVSAWKHVVPQLINLRVIVERLAQRHAMSGPTFRFR